MAQPLLWAYTGACVEGGGVRYVYLHAQADMLHALFRQRRACTRAQRRAGAPASESLEERARRLAAALSPAERAVEWPVHVAELEPQWDEAP